MTNVTALATRGATSVATHIMPQSMEEAIRLAEMMAQGKMLPEHLRGSPGDCLMVVEQAMRWGMSPFAVAQCTSSIKGKLMFEGKLVAAAIEASGAIEGGLDYTFSGEGMARKITVSARRKGDAQPKTVEVVMKDAITSNDIWKKQPDQQLVYYGSRVWGRRWTPAVMLGVYTPDEFDGQTIDAPATLAPTREPVRPALEAPKQQPKPDKSEKLQAGVDELLARMEAAAGIEDLNTILNDPQTSKQREWLAARPQYADLSTLLEDGISANVERFSADVDDFPGDVTRDAN